MARWSRKRRACKWACTTSFLLVALASVLSGWGWLTYSCVAGQRQYEFWIGAGYISFERQDLSRQAGRLGWDLWWSSSFERVFFDHISYFPWIEDYPHQDHYQRLFLPVWVPVLTLFVPTLLLWWLDRRKRRPGFCRVCDYDLTGNTTGRCPECGTPCDRAFEKALDFASRGNAEDER